MEQNNEKKMTSYERKLQAREAAAKREKKKSILTIVSATQVTQGALTSGVSYKWVAVGKE